MTAAYCLSFINFQTCFDAYFSILLLASVHGNAMEAIFFLHFMILKMCHKQTNTYTQVRCSKCYVVKYFEGSNAVKTTSIRDQKTTPLFCSNVMFESKKLKFLLLIRRKIQSEPKKVQLFSKKIVRNPLNPKGTQVH